MDQAVALKITGLAEDGDVEAEVTAAPNDLSGELRRRIAAAAFLRAEARGFEPGHELEDWLAAEAELAGAD